MTKVAQVGLDVQREAVHSHPTRDLDTHRAHLGAANPHAGETLFVELGEGGGEQGEGE